MHHNRHLPSRQLPLNELAKHQTRNICRLIATGVINLVQLSKPPKEGFEMSQDVPILLVSFPFLGTANNCESRCSIKLPAGSWLASSASPFHLAEVTRTSFSLSQSQSQPFVGQRFRWRWRGVSFPALKTLKRGSFTCPSSLTLPLLSFFLREILRSCNDCLPPMKVTNPIYPPSLGKGIFGSV